MGVSAKEVTDNFKIKDLGSAPKAGICIDISSVSLRKGSRTVRYYTQGVRERAKEQANSRALVQRAQSLGVIHEAGIK